MLKGIILESVIHMPVDNAKIKITGSISLTLRLLTPGFTKVSVRFTLAEEKKVSSNREDCCITQYGKDINLLIISPADAIGGDFEGLYTLVRKVIESLKYQ